MTTQKDIKKRIDEVFAASEEETLLIDGVTDRSAIEDFTPEEKAEVEEALKESILRKEAANPAPPRRSWKWSFWGIMLVRTLFFLLEFLLLTAVLYVFLPLAINTTITLWSTISISIILTFLRAWYGDKTKIQTK